MAVNEQRPTTEVEKIVTAERTSPQRSALDNSAKIIADAYVREHVQFARGDAIAVAIELARARELFDKSRQEFQKFLEVQASIRGLPTVTLLDKNLTVVMQVGESAVDATLTREALTHVNDTEPQVAMFLEKNYIAALIKLRGYTDTYLYISRALSPTVTAQVRAIENAAIPEQLSPNSVSPPKSATTPFTAAGPKSNDVSTPRGGERDLTSPALLVGSVVIFLFAMAAISIVRQIRKGRALDKHSARSSKSPQPLQSIAELSSIMSQPTEQFTETKVLEVTSTNHKESESTMSCLSCTAKLPSGAKYCPQCGHDNSVLPKCKKCKHDLPPNAKFCFHCGCKADPSPEVATEMSSPIKASEPQRPGRRTMPELGFLKPILIASLIAGVIYVDDQTPYGMLPDEVYCFAGAGVVVETPPNYQVNQYSNYSAPQIEVTRPGSRRCVHESLWRGWRAMIEQRERQAAAQRRLNEIEGEISKRMNIPKADK
jgi:ribosomal protein L40E